MLLIVVAHVLAAATAPVLVRALGRRAFLALALVPLATTVWALLQTGRVLDGETLTQTVRWVPGLGIELAFAMGALQWLMVLVVAGIGVLVMAYCTWYFTDDSALAGFTSWFTAFVGAMLGLVLADDLLVLFVFWELTTIFSFLLIGFDPTKRASRLAAMEALVVTTLGGLAMFVGMLVLGQQAGTSRITEILADPPTGTATTVAVALLLVGALSKSAQVPFHFWLPGAMAAPTPVSAYLHAASMVKAGLYLVALLAPAFSDVPGWHLVLLGLGTTTMVVGGWRALRQIDIKLMLAYGTVSQLGFLMVVLSIGSRTGALAGMAMLLAHALFKATLFLVVGIVDRLTGTRDVHQLSGVGRRLPVVAVAAAVAGASMAGLPPLLGFVGKETVWAALLEVAHGETPGVPGWAGWLVVAGLVAGSTLTVGYTARFWWGAFASKPGVAPTPVRPLAPPFAAAPVLLAGLTLVLGFAGAALTAALVPYADQLPAGGHEEYLALWHGLELPLLLSGITVVAGAAVFWLREPLCRFQARVASPVGAERIYRWGMRALDRSAVEVTGSFQRGSVSAYLAVILSVVLVLPGGALLLALADGGTGRLDVVWWDRAGQPVVALVMVAAAVMTVRSRRRLRAVVLAGISGYGCALMFLLHGAPDIALTQVLVETVSLVVFVLVLRRLPDYFTDKPLRLTRYWRMALASLVGLAVGGFVLVAGNARTATPISEAFPLRAYLEGYGRNVVNVTLVDIRAWDTFGEISVLVAAATGVASLIFLDSRSSGIRRVHEIPFPEGVEKQPTTPGRRVWLPGPRTLSPDRRSIIFEVVTRLVFHTVVVFSVYLLVAGHNLPGGGFAAGMVTGLALMVRYLAGGRYELDEAAPVDAGVLIGTGLFVAALSGLGPMAFGGSVLQTADVYVGLPLLGEVHLVSSVGFDIGVYLVVVGLVLDLLRTFGSRLDRQILRAERERTTEQELSRG
ncbi:multisubunit sodium/proton antiporter, MrpA subunit /multisubunit sodium/proton antiporter, MrpB subunit [Nocardioides scoriae]|uniref:Multisubunit sodium/proton antiporter, MrpA subunit /multisubunit sodium/proton antiporter, MrpB subunit n=1 Tax=Nocardioides scoriae TaxID=642780 RepID=A0A1H1LTY8_9ACTN|nr:Na+/H+ antiporter subunit A [Nocardioides scoriae]SDR77897.1 multisubunit sodium/proton antiporter, MrpA subunit /multisubunit sodium/proton antiporter, MrpB subunit [Nocardioides scoriae]